MSWTGTASNKSLPHTRPRQLLAVKHVCFRLGCIRDVSFPGSYSLNQHLVLCPVRHWHLPELDHTDLSGRGFKGQSWNYPCNKENGTEDCGSTVAPLLQQSHCHNAGYVSDRGQQDTASGCHTPGDGTSWPTLYLTGTNTAARPFPGTCNLRLSPHKTQCM